LPKTLFNHVALSAQLEWVILKLQCWIPPHVGDGEVSGARRYRVGGSSVIIK
jgi:hypothetical protein